MRGTYCLILSCKKDFSAPVGKLGILNFSEGGYIYIGSALNGLSNRLARHLRKKKKLYWHIDYLLESSYLDIDHIFYQSSAVKKECPTARLMAEEFKQCPGFGSSDCACRSHLFYFEKKERPYVFRLLGSAGYRMSKPETWLA